MDAELIQAIWNLAEHVDRDDVLEALSTLLEHARTQWRKHLGAAGAAAILRNRVAAGDPSAAERTHLESGVRDELRCVEHRRRQVELLRVIGELVRTSDEKEWTGTFLAEKLTGCRACDSCGVPVPPDEHCGDYDAKTMQSEYLCPDCYGAKEQS